MSNPYEPLSPQYQQTPMNLAAEMALLGALLSNNRALTRCEGLKAEHFAGENHGAVFQAIVDGVAAGRVVDCVTLRWEFDHAMLTSLVAAMVGIINAGDYARVIREAALARQLIDIGETLVNAARKGISPRDISTMTTRQIDELMAEGQINTSQWSLDGAMDDALAAMERARTGAASGIKTGFAAFDARLGGLEPGQVYIVAGRPGAGKSSIGHQIAITAARAGVGVLELSLEMSARQLGMRALSSASGVPLNRIKSGGVDMFEAERVVRARHELSGLPLTIDDAGGQTPSQIAMKARAAKRKGLGLVMIDHLNLMAAEDRDARNGSTWATERASATVLQIAKECGCPVLLLAQLNRGVESREDKRPVLSDLRQAGAIEQDAYAVGFVYRHEYYLREPMNKEGERPELFAERQRQYYEAKEASKGVAELIWAKVRDGEPGTDKLHFDAPTTTFSSPWGDRT